MILIFFILAVLTGAIFLFLGNSQSSFPMVYLGMFVFLILGMFLMSEGIDIDQGASLVESPAGSGNYITSTNFTTYTTQNNFVVNLLANTFFYIPFAGIFLSLSYALYQWKD